MTKISNMARELLELAEERGALTFGDFVLSSGLRSSYYFDGRKLTLDARGARLTGKVFFEMLRDSNIKAIGGPELGANPIATAVALTSDLNGKPLSAFIVRKKGKAHGTGQLIEGPLEPGSRVAIVDDTCSTGASLFHAVKAAEDQGCEVAAVLALLDRHQGGSEKLKKRNYTFHCLLEATPEGKIRTALNLDFGRSAFWKRYWRSLTGSKGTASNSDDGVILEGRFGLRRTWTKARRKLAIGQLGTNIVKGFGGREKGRRRVSPSLRCGPSRAASNTPRKALQRGSEGPGRA